MTPNEAEMVYEDVNEVKPFVEVASERDYTIGENAEDMAVGKYEGENVFLESQDETEASYNVMADVLATQLSEYNVRAPSAFYDSNSILQEVDADLEGVLITEELGNGGEMNESSDNLNSYTESLIDTFAFEALMGQGDIPENTSSDSQGFYMFDFGNAGANIKGVYDAIKNQARSVAEDTPLESEIQNYDVIGDRAVQMAQDIDLKELAGAAEARGVTQEAYMDIESNIITASDKPDAESIDQYFSPDDSSDDVGVELL